MLRRQDRLRADFQQYYGLNLSDAGGGYTWTHAADLAAQLPAGARSWADIAPQLRYTLDQQLVAAQTNALRLIKWRLDGYKSKAKPQLIDLYDTGGKTERERRQTVGFDTPEQLMAALDQTRLTIKEET